MDSAPPRRAIHCQGLIVHQHLKTNRESVLMCAVVPTLICWGAVLNVALVTDRVCLGGDATATASAPQIKPVVSFAAVRALTLREYRAEANKLPNFLNKLSYDDYA
jgi:hypothetical protein